MNFFFKNHSKSFFWFVLGVIVAVSILSLRLKAMNDYLQGCQESARDLLESQNSREARFLEYIDEGRIEMVVNIIKGQVTNQPQKKIEKDKKE